MDEELSSLDFTEAGWQSIYNVVDDGYFQEHEADVIFSELLKRMRFIPFGEYLKRYIYQKENMETAYPDVPIKVYQQYILQKFEESGTPKSFKPTTAKLSALVKNWLTQQSVRRNVVFLLGFGLSMNVADVNTLLRKGLKQQGINAKNPFEVICWYCYRFGYGYQKYEELWNRFLTMDPRKVMFESIADDRTVNVRNNLFSIRDESSLFAMIGELKTRENEMKYSVTARQCFDRLYAESRKLIADIYNQDDCRHRHYTPDDISARDIEQMLYSSVPIDGNGNLVAGRKSTLNNHFQGERLSRRQIADILSGKTDVSRFDLITLNFFIFSQKIDEFATVNKRYDEFLASTNRILEDCYLDQLYTANPYESFILMCILSEDPLVTYSDVMEMSYHSCDE